jgi:tellurite resistance protein
MLWGKKKLSLEQIRNTMSSDDNLYRSILVVMGAASADGTVGNDEVEAGHTLIMRMFKDKFDARDVERQIAKVKEMFVEGPISARREIMKACRDVESPEEQEALFSLAADVCGKSGNIGPEEDKWLREWLAPKLGVKAEDFLG